MPYQIKEQNISYFFERRITMISSSHFAIFCIILVSLFALQQCMFCTYSLFINIYTTIVVKISIIFL